MVYEHLSRCFISKDTKGFCPIVIGEVFFQLISRSIVLQLQGLLQEHLSHNQFGISTFRCVKASLLASKPSSIYTLIEF
jgi:hypothetical protein